jgi:hypothetical protein
MSLSCARARARARYPGQPAHACVSLRKHAMCTRSVPAKSRRRGAGNGGGRGSVEVVVQDGGEMYGLRVTCVCW